MQEPANSQLDAQNPDGPPAKTRFQISGRMISGKARPHRVAGMRTHVGVATSLRGAHATRLSILSSEGEMDCFAEPVIGRRFAPTRWLAMTMKSATSDHLAPLAGRGRGRGRGRAIRSPILTIFWHCGFRHFSFRTGPERGLGNQPSMVLAEDSLPKGLAMLIRSEMDGVQGGAANAVRPEAIPAASLPTLLIGGLLLLICP